jgi:beta-phosphoglucomutase
MIHRLAVIFDMDGVLVDSYHAHFRSWLAMAREARLDFTQQEFDATFGRTSREIIAALWKDRRLSDEEIAALDDRKEAMFRQMLRADFRPMPGAACLLEALRRAGFALGVGSSGPPENVELVLDRLAERSLWGAVVTGKDVTRGKPDPQVFLLAAERLGIAPARCAVIEDAPAGMAAARAAGMASVGLVSTGRTRALLARADLVVDSLDQLTPEAMRALIEAKEGRMNDEG